MFLVNLKNKKVGKSLEDEAWGIIIKSDSEDWELIGNRQLYSDFKERKKTGHPISRYWVQDDGTARKCDPKDSSKFLDGSKVPLDKGQIMVYLPRLYYLVKEDKENNCRYLWMSDHDIGGHYLESSMIGAFLCTNYGGKAYSRPSGNIGEDWSLISSFERNQAVGKNFNNMDYDQLRYLIMLHLSEFGSIDIQKTIGRGEKNYVSYVGNTLKCGDNIGYYDKASTNIKEYNFGKQNFLGIEGIIHKLTLLGGSLSHDYGIYIYKDPNNLYTTKEEIVKLGKDNYRVISNTYKQSNTFVADIIGEDYFDVFMSKSSNNPQKNWGEDRQENLFDGNNKELVLFGNSNWNYAGLLNIKPTNSPNYYSSVHACRNGYFGPIKFI